MYDDAIAWAESALGLRISGWSRLPGGLTSTILALSDTSGRQSVLRLMTNEPWRKHGAALTTREHAALDVLASTPVPAALSLGLDADGVAAGESAHLTSRLPGMPTVIADRAALVAMANMLATIHDVQPPEPFRTYESWAWEAKHTLPGWTAHPASCQYAFELLADEPPTYEPTFLHRDFSHRNLLWTGGAISGVVDWVETSTGPAWLDAGHAATNLAVGFGLEHAVSFLAAYGAQIGGRPDLFWLIMDAVGFLPQPGKEPMFGSRTELTRLDEWLHDLVTRHIT